MQGDKQRNASSGSQQWHFRKASKALLSYPLFVPKPKVMTMMLPWETTRDDPGYKTPELSLVSSLSLSPKAGGHKLKAINMIPFLNVCV